MGFLRKFRGLPLSVGPPATPVVSMSASGHPSINLLDVNFGCCLTRSSPQVFHLGLVTDWRARKATSTRLLGQLLLAPQNFNYRLVALIWLFGGFMCLGKGIKKVVKPLQIKVYLLIHCPLRLGSN